jgi:hypothetical protein
LIIRISGDANDDGKVDVADLNAVGLNWRMSGKTWSDGDFNDDGEVNAADLNILALNWQFGVGNPASVPEPGTVSMLMTLLMLGPLGRTFVRRTS